MTQRPARAPAQSDGPTAMSGKDHWNEVFGSKSPCAVSWYQDRPDVSLRLLGRVEGASVIDAGAGTSRLVDHLLAGGARRVTLLDLSEAALTATRQRLSPDQRADRVDYLIADLASWSPEPARRDGYDLWHDRAVLHFLTAPAERAAYIHAAAAVIRPGGSAVIGCFAPDGPTHCSGLPTVRRSAEQLRDEFSGFFELDFSETETHHAPSGTQQQFTWVRLKPHDAV